MSERLEMSEADAGSGFEQLLEHIRLQRGFDFRAYKRATLDRRIAKRMAAVGVEDHEAYLDRLQVDPDEFGALFNTILINVTSFYRDPEAWDFLRSDVIPKVVDGKRADEPIRVWTAGCASGEETFTVAALLADALGYDRYLDTVKIYATDVDHDALKSARQGVFSAEQVQALPADVLSRYFERTNSKRTFRKDLRRSIIFGANDLVQDAPISRIDLLVCRNTLMYFNAESQGRILARFHFALNPGGYLFMGKAEMLITHGDLFQPLSLKHRVFGKVARDHRPERLATRMAALDASGMPRLVEDEWGGARLHAPSFEVAPHAEVVFDADEVLQLANREARATLGVAHEDIGRPLKDLSLSYRPIELRSHLEAVRAAGKEVRLDGVAMHGPPEQQRVFDVRIAPLMSGGRLIGTSAAFLDVTTHERLRVELEVSRREVEHSYEELQSTVEELETTNEELQSTNEELETTNEELQSTNEELETMNAELQSINEELETINEELRDRTSQLHEVNAFLETILKSLTMSVVVLDRSLRVVVWNETSAEYWGLRREEVEGEHLLGLDFGLPVEQLKAVARACLEGRSEREDLVVRATNRRGRAFDCAVTALPMRLPSGEISAVILLLQEAQADGSPRHGAS